MAEFIDIVMTVGPHHSGEFVECEDDEGQGVGPASGIEWIKPGEDPNIPDDPYWRLRIPWNVIAMIGESDG